MLKVAFLICMSKTHLTVHKKTPASNLHVQYLRVCQIMHLGHTNVFLTYIYTNEKCYLLHCLPLGRGKGGKRWRGREGGREGGEGKWQRPGSSIFPA